MPDGGAVKLVSTFMDWRFDYVVSNFERISSALHRCVAPFALFSQDADRLLVLSRKVPPFMKLEI